MKLKQERSQISIDFSKYLRAFSKYLKFYVLIFLVIIALAGGFSLGLMIGKDENFRVKADDVIINIKSVLRYNIKKIIPYFGPELPKVAIDIKHKNFQKIAYQRKEALEKKMNITSSEDYVPAKMIINNKTHKVKLRLKGIFNDHWNSPNKWSLKVKSKKPVLDMTKFSLIIPKARDYIHEWLYIRLLEYEGLISRKVDYVNVSINGKDNGLYIAEEDPSPQLLKRNGLVPGPVVGYSKDLYVREQLRNKKQLINIISSSAGFQARDIDPSRSSKIKIDTEQYRLYQKAVSMMEAFRNKEISVEEAFNTDKLATYMALRALCASGEFDPNDTKFYFNPITSKLEPLGAEIHHKPIRVGKWWVNAGLRDRALFADLFLGDMDFFAKYIKELRRVSKKEYLDKFFNIYDEQIERVSSILRGYYKDFTFHKGEYYRNQNYINLTLNPFKGIKAYFYNVDNNSNEIILHLANTESLPMEVINLSLKLGDKELVLEPVSKKKIILKSKQKIELMSYIKESFQLPLSFDWNPSFINKLYVNYRILGSEEIKSTTVAKWRYLSKSQLIDDLKSTVYKSNFREFHFLKLDKEKNEIKALPGNWNLSKTLYIPKGYKFVVLGGTVLNLLNSASIISYSPVYFGGTEENPVIFKSPDQKGGGIAIIGAQELSLIHNVVFDGLSRLNKTKDIDFDAALNFYESPARINDIELSNTRFAKGISFMRSKFRILNSSFKAVDSTFVESKFSWGLIQKSTFANSMNSAISNAGSFLRVDNCYFHHIKNIAVISQAYGIIELMNLDINETKYGVVSIDAISTTLKNSSIKDADVGIVALKKDNEFNTVKVKGSKISFEEVKLHHLLQKGSTLTLNGKVQKSNASKHKGMLKFLKSSL